MVSFAATRKGASTNRLSQLGRRLGRWLPPFWGIGSFLLIWQILAMVNLIALPAPSSLLSEERTRNLGFLRKSARHQGDAAGTLRAFMNRLSA